MRCVDAWRGADWSAVRRQHTFKKILIAILAEIDGAGFAGRNGDDDPFGLPILAKHYPRLNVDPDKALVVTGTDHRIAMETVNRR